jgi:integrase/recombinase XerD
MDRHIEAFLEMMAAERGAARNTLAAYRADLEDLGAFLAARGERLSAARPEGLRAYLASLGAQGLSPRTQARRLASIRQFHKFLLREGVRPDDPGRMLDGPRTRRFWPPPPRSKVAPASRCGPAWRSSMRAGCASPNCWPCRRRL